MKTSILNRYLIAQFLLIYPLLLPFTFAFEPSNKNWIKPTFGIEEEYISPLIGVTFVYQRKFILALFEACKTHPTLSCTREGNVFVFFSRTTGKEITTMTIHPDGRVIEVNASGFINDALEEEVGSVFQLALFDVPEKVGLERPTLGGEGHLHKGFESSYMRNSKINYELFRNDVVDKANHNELYYGALHYDPLAKIKSHPLLQTRELREKFKAWLKEYDQILDEGRMTPEIFNELRLKLKWECGFKKTSAFNVWPDEKKPLGTVEWRAARPKKNMAHLKLYTHLEENRLNYLNQRGRLPYYDNGVIQNSQDGVNLFYRYVTEAHLDYQQYKELLPEGWKTLTPEVLSDEKLFAPGKLTIPFGFKCNLILNIHLLNR